MIVFNYPNYFGTRMCKILKENNITMLDLTIDYDYEVAHKLESIRGIGIISLLKITKCRLEYCEALGL